MEWLGVETKRDAVFQALGAASTCWETLNGAGVFQSERCKAIGEALLLKLEELDESSYRADGVQPEVGN